MNYKIITIIDGIKYTTGTKISHDTTEQIISRMKNTILIHHIKKLKELIK